MVSKAASDTKDSILCMPDTNQITTHDQGKGEWWNTHTHTNLPSKILVETGKGIASRKCKKYALKMKH